MRIQSQSETFAYRVARELPEGVRYENYGGDTNAYIGKQNVGYLRTAPPIPALNKGPTIDMIRVHPNHQRKGIASGMLKWHRENVGPVDHGSWQTPEGHAWALAQGQDPKREWFPRSSMPDLGRW